MRPMKAIVGFVVAPLIPGLLFGVVGEFCQGGAGLLWCLALSATAGYPTAILFGIPVYIAFGRYHVTRFIAYFATGLILGFVPYLAALSPDVVIAALSPVWGAKIDPSLWIGIRGSLSLLAVSALCGGVASAAFWLIVRPDRATHRQQV